MATLTIKLDSAQARKDYGDLDKLLDKLETRINKIEKAYMRAGTSIAQANAKIAQTTKASAKSASEFRLAIKNLATDIVLISGTIYTMEKAIHGLLMFFDAGVQFEKQMKTVFGVMREYSDKAGNLQAELTASAKSQRTGAVRAAEALQYLGMAGLSATESMSALPEVIKLARNGEMDLARATDIATDIMTGFRLEIVDLSHVNDVLTGTITRTNTNIEQLGQAMKFVGPVAAAMGVEIEFVSAALGRLASAGIKGGLAGRALRSAMLDTAKIADKLGLSSETTFRDLLKRMGQINLGMRDIGLLVGKRSATSVAILIEDMEEVEKLERILQEASKEGGETARLYAEKMHSLGGAIAFLKGSFEYLRVEITEKYGPRMRVFFLDLASSMRENKDTIINTLDKIVEKAEYTWRLAKPALVGLGKTIDTIVSGLLKIPPPIVEAGIIGLLLFGKRRALVAGAGVAVNYVERMAKAIALWQEGVLSAEDIIFSSRLWDGKSLSDKISDFDKNFETAVTKPAEIKQFQIVDDKQYWAMVEKYGQKSVDMFLELGQREAEAEAEGFKKKKEEAAENKPFEPTTSIDMANDMIEKYKSRRKSAMDLELEKVNQFYADLEKVIQEWSGKIPAKFQDAQGKIMDIFLPKNLKANKDLEIMQVMAKYAIEPEAKVKEPAKKDPFKDYNKYLDRIEKDYKSIDTVKRTPFFEFEVGKDADIAEENARYADKLKRLRDYYEQKRLLDEWGEEDERKHLKAIEKLNDIHKEEMYQINKKYMPEEERAWRESAEGKFNVMSDILGNVSDLLLQGNKEQFDAGKKLAIAQAMIDTYLGAQKAFTSLAGIPVIGPALGIAAAATATAAGFHRVNMIRSMEFEGQAHGGLDFVPKTGTYLLERGEKVIKKEDAKSPQSQSIIIKQEINVDLRNSSGVNREDVMRAAEEGAMMGYSKVADDFKRRGQLYRSIK